MTLAPIKGFLDGICPPDRLTPSEWADTYRKLSSSASAEPGQWRTSRAPYLREIMDRFSPYDECIEVVVMKGAQLGLTEAGYNILGYYIDRDPCPIMYVMPTMDTIKRNSKQRISPMIESTPQLAKKIKPARKKDSGNSMFQKDYPGGTLILSGANSAATLRSVPIRVLVLDEADAYPLDLEGEGSPIDLARARTRTFAKKKIMLFSTPLIHGQSVVEAQYIDSSQRKYYVPCPECGLMQFLSFDQLKYDKDPTGKIALNVHYECCGCQAKIQEHKKTEMLANGEWRDTVPEKVNPKKWGYQISSLYSPLGWYSWEDAANDWLAAQSNVSKLKVFVNTVLGETWLEKGEVPDWENLYNRRIEYNTNSPQKEICFITVGVDVQKDRLELEVVGWSKDKISYSIDYRILAGETAAKPVWDELAKVVNETWTREDGCILPVHKMTIDTGYNTNEVYTFCRRFSSGQVLPIKGNDRQTVIISQPRPVDHKRNKKKRKHSLTGLTLYHVGVGILKMELYGWLKLKIEEGEIPPGYCFFPKAYDEHFFKMLTAEQLTKKLVKGFTRYEWEKIRDRNEALDCRIYARAAATIAGMDRWRPEDWEAIGKGYAFRQTKPAKPKKKKSSFWDR